MELIRITDLVNRYGLSRSTVYRLRRQDPTFPRPIKLKTGSVRHRPEETDAYFEACRMEGDGESR